MALVKSADVWLLYEDDSVEPVPDSTVQQTFGAASDYTVGCRPMCCRVQRPMHLRTISVWFVTEGCCSCCQGRGVCMMHSCLGAQLKRFLVFDRATRATATSSCTSGSRQRTVVAADT